MVAIKSTDPKIAEIINAMRSRDTWRTYKKAQAQKIAGKVPEDKCKKFADWLNLKFVAICDEMNIFDMARDWAALPDSDKLAVAQKIIRRFVDIMRGESLIGRQVSKDDTDEYTDVPMPEFSVQGTSDGLMSVSNLGVVNINPRWPYYNDLGRFLMDLRHEAAHIVDIFFPDLSPLDSAVRRDAMMFYVDGHDDFGLYSKNPLELNANMGRDEFGELVRTKIAVYEYMRARGAMRGGERSWTR